MVVSKSQLKSFLQEYLREFNERASIFSEKWKKDVFPSFFIEPHKMSVVISNVHGVAIEFAEKSESYVYSFTDTEKRIECAVLPQTSVENVAFQIGSSRNAGVSDMAVFFEGFRKKYVLSVAGTALILQHHLNGFTNVDRGGDVKFVNVLLGAEINGKPLMKYVSGCLWIFGSNVAEDYTLENANKRATEDVNWYLGLSSLGMTLFPQNEELSRRLEEFSRRISEFRRLISKNEVKEKDIQKFLEANPKFLSFGNKYVRFVARVLLKRKDKPDLIPDFFLERAIDGFYDILDIKLPRKTILTGIAQRKRFTAEVEDAIAQVSEYREYFDEDTYRQEAETKYNIKALKPDVMILVGNGSNMEREDLLRINDRYRYVKIVTYEDILKQASYHLEYLRKFVAGT